MALIPQAKGIDPDPVAVVAKKRRRRQQQQQVCDFDGKKEKIKDGRYKGGHTIGRH